MTIGGLHSVAEVKELIAAKDYDIAQIQAAFDASSHVSDEKWLRGGRDAWAVRWGLFRSHYDKKKAAALFLGGTTAMGNVLFGDENVPNETGWNLVLSAFKPGLGQDGVNIDFHELYNLLTTATGRQVDFSGQPQPKPSDDTDLRVFQATEDIDLLGDHEDHTTRNLLLAVGAGAALVLILRR